MINVTLIWCMLTYCSQPSWHCVNCHCLGPTIKVAWGSKSEGQIWSFCAVPGWQCVGRSGEKRMFSSKNHQFRLSFEKFEDSLVSMCNDVKRLRARIGGDWVVTFGLPTRCHFSVKPFIHDPCSTLSSSLSVPMWNINWSTNQDSHRRARDIVVRELAASIVVLEVDEATTRERLMKRENGVGWNQSSDIISSLTNREAPLNFMRGYLDVVQINLAWNSMVLPLSAPSES